jgi:predicted amidophosphoribosyltransferase
MNERGINTEMILALQEYKYQGRPAALEYFGGILDKALVHEIPIVLIPSHDPGYDHQKASSGLFQLTERLTTNNRINAASCLVRHTLVAESSSWGDRSVEKHLQSIKVVNASLVESRAVLLMDDIATTGNSMRACKRLLMDHGAKVVACLVLGLTEGKPGNK